MDQSKPRNGGISAVLQLIAILTVIFSLLGGALANLSLGSEVVLLVSSIVTAALLWAAAVVVQELRNIEFNTRKGATVSVNVSDSPAVPKDSMDEAGAFRTYGIKKDGDKYRFGEYRYDNLQDAVKYAQRSEVAYRERNNIS